jgi:hypothetical protein
MTAGSSAADRRPEHPSDFTYEYGPGELTLASRARGQVALHP